MPTGYYFNKDNIFGPGDEIKYDLIFVIGKDDNKAIGYHRSEDGSISYGDISHNRYGVIQFRIKVLKSGSDFRLRFKQTQLPREKITVEIFRDEKDPVVFEVTADHDNGMYSTSLTKAIKDCFVVGEELKVRFPNYE